MEVERLSPNPPSLGGGLLIRGLPREAPVQNALHAQVEKPCLRLTEKRMAEKHPLCAKAHAEPPRAEGPDLALRSLSPSYCFGLFCLPPALFQKLLEAARTSEHYSNRPRVRKETSTSAPWGGSHSSPPERASERAMEAGRGICRSKPVNCQES